MNLYKSKFIFFFYIKILIQWKKKLMNAFFLLAVCWMNRSCHDLFGRIQAKSNKTLLSCMRYHTCERVHTRFMQSFVWTIFCLQYLCSLIRLSWHIESPTTSTLSHLRDPLHASILFDKHKVTEIKYLIYACAIFIQFVRLKKKLLLVNQ